MRIVHVVQGLGIGGQGRLVVELSHELARRGHEPAIVTLSLGGEMRREARVPVHDVPRPPGPDASFVGRLAYLLRRERAEVVHTHNPAPFLHAMPAAILARIGRRVHTQHGANTYGERGLWAARALVRVTDAVVAVSPYAAELARVKERVPLRCLRVVPRGIPLRPFHPDIGERARVRAELGIARDAFVVGSVGRLAAEKDYPLLVRALAPSLSERVRLVLVGDGPARAAIAGSVPPEVSRFVTFTGARRDVPSLLASFDLFALASRGDVPPLAVSEAMASGLPVVAPAAGGMAGAVPPGAGVLVPSGDERALAAAIAQLAREPRAARMMGQAARRHALANFSIERVADAYERIYRGA
jgi:glycosyltransferase involved in cell wall biosynthesis